MATREELERRAEEERRRAVEDAARARAEYEVEGGLTSDVGRGAVASRLDYGTPSSDIFGNSRGGGTRRTPQVEREQELMRRDDARRREYLDADPSMTPRYTYEDTVDAGRSAWESDARADLGSIEAQRRALDMMREQAETRGMTPAERSMMQAGVRSAEQSARGQRQADMQALEARGMGGSGMSMLSGQMASDSAADRAADLGAQTLMAAQQRALAAMESYGSQAAGMRGQSFQESATRAGGMDAWNQALAERAQGVQARNTERYNQGQDQGYANRFQREAMAQGLYGIESQKAEAERDRAYGERTGREAQRTQFVGGLIGSVGGLARSAIGG